MSQNQELFQEMHNFMMQFFDKMHELEPNPEMLAALKSDKGLRLTKTITDFYCSILTEKEVEWIVKENFNGTGKQILNKILINMDQLKTTLAPSILEFELD